VEKYGAMISQVVIFAGGKGTRLGIDNAKCLVEVAGEPIINYIIREFSNQNVNKFHFCLGFYADAVIDHLKSLDINFTYSLDPEKSCGTWKALENSREYLDNEFFVTYGDSVAFCDLELMYWQYVESEQSSMMSVSNYKSAQSNVEISLSLNPNCIAGTKNPNFVEHGVSIFSKKELEKENTKRPFNFSDYFMDRILGKIHYANANYYQINTPQDHKDVDRIFKTFKTQSEYNFLDRDGTINKWDSDIYSHMNFKPVDDLLDKLNDADCVIVTNQPDKAKQIATLSNINRMTWEARQHLIDNGKNVIFSMSCIHRDVQQTGDSFDDLRFVCLCRKPEVGMLEKASNRISISKTSTFYGDSDCDEECAKNYGLKFIKMYN
jgi:HAD superfamily hydrolase (TIGR01662 family)